MTAASEARDELQRVAKTEKQARDFFSDWYKRGSKKGDAGLTWIEFALGGSPGAPDTLVPTGKKLVGCELKLGEFRGPDGAMLVKFRPAQINWHTEMARGGIKTFAFIYTRMGAFCVRGRDVKRFANGECVDWPEIASKVSGEIHSFFSMMENDEQHSESVENYKRNVERIEREMDGVRRNPKGSIDGANKTGSKAKPKNARAVAASIPKAINAPKAKPTSAVPNAHKALQKAGVISKAKTTWPKQSAPVPKKQIAPQTRARHAAALASQKAAKRSTAAPRRASNG